MNSIQAVISLSSIQTPEHLLSACEVFHAPNERCSDLQGIPPSPHLQTNGCKRLLKLLGKLELVGEGEQVLKSELLIIASTEALLRIHLRTLCAVR